MKKLTLAFLTAALFISGSIFGATPQVAKADTNSTIATAAAAIIGILAFDSSNRPYYVRDGRRVYVSDDVANYYVRQRDPGWYSQHRGDWQRNRGQFSRQWNNSHQGGNWNNGNNGNNGHGHNGYGH